MARILPMPINGGIVPPWLRDPIYLPVEPPQSHSQGIVGEIGISLLSGMFESAYCVTAARLVQP